MGGVFFPNLTAARLLPSHFPDFYHKEKCCAIWCGLKESGPTIPIVTGQCAADFVVSMHLPFEFLKKQHVICQMLCWWLWNRLCTFFVSKQFFSGICLYWRGRIVLKGGTEKRWPVAKAESAQTRAATNHYLGLTASTRNWTRADRAPSTCLTKCATLADWLCTSLILFKYKVIKNFSECTSGNAKNVHTSVERYK